MTFSGSKLQIAVATAHNRRDRPVEQEKCFLCNVSPAKSRRAFVKHVGKHMEEIALMALPREAEDDSAESSTTTGEGDDHSQNSTTKSSDTMQPFIANSRLVAKGEGSFLADRAGALENLECPFNVLLCYRAFSKTEDWIEHSMTHFGEVGPPKSNRCCFCAALFESSSDIRSWRDRMNHVAFHHQMGCRLSDARPDFELCTYMWNKRLITEAEYQCIERMPPLPKIANSG